MEYVAGIAGIAVGAFSFMGMQSLGGESPIGMVDYIEIGCSDTTPLKVFAAAVLLLPFVFFLYAGHDEALYMYVDGHQPVVLIDECGNYGNIY